MVRSMGKLKDNFANQSKGYITFCDFFKFLCDFTGDEPKDVISYLAIQQEFRRLNYYFIIHNYPNVEIIKRAYDALAERDDYPIENFIDTLMFDNGVIHTETEEIFLDNYFKIDELFELGFFAEIGLNTERYYSHKRAIQHGIELGIIDKNGIEIDKPSDLQQQLASATNTINRQAEKITELKAQLASIEQAGKDTQSNDKLLSNVELNNLKKAVIAENNRQIATILKSMDIRGELSKDDLLQVIRPNMESMAKVLNGENSYKALLVIDNTIKDNHLKSLSFQTGRKTKEQTEKKSIQLIFDREKPPITEN